MSITVTVDGIPVTVEEGATVADAATAAGAYVPTLCFHEDHPALGTCRVCAARLDGRVVAACSAEVHDGAEVEVVADDLATMRRQVVGLLFAEGNHVCPSCEKSGRCDLQAVAAETGMLASEFPYRYPRREADGGDARIWLARDRCILCQRCVDLVRDDEGRPVFTLSGRGPDTRLEIDHETAAGLSGEQVAAAVDLCPVGALLRKGVGYDDPIGARRFDVASVRERALRGERR